MQTQHAGDPTAVMGRRIGAYIIDTLIILAVFGVAFFALAEDDPTAFSQDQGEAIGRAFGDSDPDSNFDATWDFGEGVGGFIAVDEDDFDFTIRIAEGGTFWTINALGFGVAIGLLVVMQGLTGKTPGKAITGITTVAADGSTPGIGRAFVRWLLLIVDAGLCFLPGLISSLASKGHRRIGDMAGGTYVVRSAAAGQPVNIGGVGGTGYAVASPPAQPSADAQWDPARQAWIRWDGTAWMQHDPNVPGGWRPVS